MMSGESPSAKASPARGLSRRAGFLLAQLGTVPGLSTVLERLGFDEVPGPADAASAIEFTLEGLHLTRRLAKDFLADGRTVYGGE